MLRDSATAGGMKGKREYAQEEEKRYARERERIHTGKRSTTGVPINSNPMLPVMKLSYIFLPLQSANQFLLQRQSQR